MRSGRRWIHDFREPVPDYGFAIGNGDQPAVAHFSGLNRPPLSWTTRRVASTSSSWVWTITSLLNPPSVQTLRPIPLSRIRLSALAGLCSQYSRTYDEHITSTPESPVTIPCPRLSPRPNVGVALLDYPSHKQLRVGKRSARFMLKAIP